MSSLFQRITILVIFCMVPIFAESNGSIDVMNDVTNYRIENAFGFNNATTNGMDEPSIKRLRKIYIEWIKGKEGVDNLIKVYRGYLRSGQAPIFFEHLIQATLDRLFWRNDFNRNELTAFNEQGQVFASYYFAYANMICFDVLRKDYCHDNSIYALDLLKKLLHSKKPKVVEFIEKGQFKRDVALLTAQLCAVKYSHHKSEESKDCVLSQLKEFKGYEFIFKNHCLYREILD